MSVPNRGTQLVRFVHSKIRRLIFRLHFGKTPEKITQKEVTEVIDSYIEKVREMGEETLQDEVMKRLAYKHFFHLQGLASEYNFNPHPSGKKSSKKQRKEDTTEHEPI